MVRTTYRNFCVYVCVRVIGYRESVEVGVISFGQTTDGGSSVTTRVSYTAPRPWSVYITASVGNLLSTSNPRVRSLASEDLDFVEKVSAVSYIEGSVEEGSGSPFHLC